MTTHRHPLDYDGLRRLGIFIALSLLAHFFIVLGGALPLPQSALEVPLLTARLEPTTPPSARPHHVVKPHPAPLPAAPAIPPVIVTTTPTPESTASAPTEPAVEAGDSGATAAAPPELVRSLPHQGQIKYVLYYGAAGWIVGETLQTWSIDHDHHYRFTSRSATGGLVRLFNRQHLNYESEGEITPDGLRPLHFTAERRRSGTTEQTTVDFDWNAMAVTLDAPPRTVSLPVHAQDIVSFMYQLGLTALQPGHLELPVTNGWKLEHYQIEVGAAETIDTPLGKLKAIPVRQIPQPGKESIELWLATEYRMLPAKIRFFDRDGQPAGEQLVSDIRVSDE